MMTYNEYLFGCLLQLYDKEFEEMEYDLRYEETIRRYCDFESSEFNVDTQSEYMCILDYLESKYLVTVGGEIIKKS